MQNQVFVIPWSQELYLKITIATLWDAHKGSSGFTCNTKFDVEDFCIDIFYYFDRSTKRNNALQGYAEFCDQGYRDILKHINVRWLSLERAVERILLQYSSLRAYVLSENAPKSATNSNDV